MGSEEKVEDGRGKREEKREERREKREERGVGGLTMMTGLLEGTHCIEPLGDVLVLDVTPVDVVTAGGLVVPVAVQPAETRMEGTIVARGPQCAVEALQAGRRVYVGKYVSNEIPRGGRKYRLAREGEVLAVLG